MMKGILLIAQNLGVSFENLVIIIMILASTLFFARNFKVGTVMLFLSSGCVFMWFQAAGYQVGVVLTIFFLSLIFMVMSLYAVGKEQEGGFL
jgi:hypothetical protein